MVGSFPDRGDRRQVAEKIRKGRKSFMGDFASSSKSDKFNLSGHAPIQEEVEIGFESLCEKNLRFCGLVCGTVFGKSQ